MTRILLADDEESIRTMMRMTLELDGHQVFTAENGCKALEVYRRERPDIVILDVKMPEMDGIEVLRNIREINTDAEVIIISGHGDMDMAVECLRHDASNFLTKPVGDELLSLTLKRSLEKLALKHKLKQYTRNLETLVREANEELERAYQFRENIIENCPDALVYVRKGGEIMIFNSAAQKLLGYRKSEVIGKMNIRNIYPPDEAKTIMKDMKSDDFGGPGILQKRQVTLLARNGERIPVYISAAIIFENGIEAGSVGIFTDLREKLKLERQIFRSEKLSSLGKLSAGIAREINQPLAEVLTQTNLLLKKFKDDDATCKDLDVILRETTRIRSIVAGILDFAREMPMQKKSMHVEDVLDRTLEIFIRQQRFSGITLIKEYGSDVPEVVIDANLLEQVFMNVIFNALEAIPGTGALTVRTRRDKEFVNIDFEDTGPGMPEEMIDKIFDPFFTTKSSSEGMGMGLGLAVSYGIVRNHSGDIIVHSTEGQGMTFTIRLPLKGE